MESNQENKKTEDQEPKNTDVPKPVEPEQETLRSSALASSLKEDHLADPVLNESPQEIDTSAHKFDLEPPSQEPIYPPKPAYEDLGELPASYGTRRLFIAPRDPHYLFCYWDLNFDQLADAERIACDGKVFLQIYEESGQRVQQIHIQPWSKDWMVHVQSPNTVFYAEIGTYRHDGFFEILTRSTRVRTPRDDMSPNTSSRFVTIPFHLSFAELKQMIEGLGSDGERLADTLCRLQDEGYPLPFEFEGREEMTEADRLKLLETLGGEIVKRTWKGSEEIIELINNSFELRPSSGQWPPSSHWLASSSLSSPYGGERDFYMNLNAEVIIYGGTHPDADLRIDGKKIQLKEDGTFYFHFNFDEGQYHIPVDATSPDGQELRSALLSLFRATDRGKGVDPTAQDTERGGPLGKAD